MNVGFLDQQEIVSKVLRSQVCSPSLRTQLPTVRTRNVSRSLGLYPAKTCWKVLPYPYVCQVCLFVCQCSPGAGCGEPASLMSDQRSQSGGITTHRALSLCAGAYPCGRRQKPYLLTGRAGQVC